MAVALLRTALSEHGLLKAQQVMALEAVLAELEKRPESATRKSCWPADQDAAFRGMRAQGGFIVSGTFKKGRVESATIESVTRKTLRLLSPWKTLQVNGRPASIDKNGIATIETKAGDRLVFTEGAPHEPIAADHGAFTTVHFISLTGPSRPEGRSSPKPREVENV